MMWSCGQGSDGELLLCVVHQGSYKQLVSLLSLEESFVYVILCKLSEQEMTFFAAALTCYCTSAECTVLGNEIGEAVSQEAAPQKKRN